MILVSSTLFSKNVQNKQMLVKGGNGCNAYAPCVNIGTLFSSVFFTAAGE